MPVIKHSDYKAPFFLFSGDLQTIIPALVRKVKTVTYKRERIKTPDNDFLDLDWSFSSLGTKKLLIISHGLEGNSMAPYVLGMAKAANTFGFQVLAWNYRGCSGSPNQKIHFYHSGETNDLDWIIQYAISKGFSELYLVGFSIGGNITLKYLGENRPKPGEIRSAAAISVPCHLKSAAFLLAKRRSKIYMNRFLKSLKNKIEQKEKVLAGAFKSEKLRTVKNFLEFDSIFTAPVNGFKDAFDYWEKNSSLYYLAAIQIPTLILNAANDPFLTPECFPIQEAETNQDIYLEIPPEGGHCGFTDEKLNRINWAEKRILSFFDPSLQPVDKT